MSQAGALVPNEGTIAREFVTNSGTAVPFGTILNILGENGITTTGAGNTVTVLGINATAAATAGAAQIGVASFNSDNFSVVDGFVSYTGGAAFTIGDFDETSTAKGLSLSSNILYLHAADATNPGAVSVSAQSYAGVKTFNNNLITLGNFYLNTSNPSINTNGSVNINGGVFSGVDISALDTTITNSIGTGTGVVGKFYIKADASGTSSGSSAHTSVNRLIINGSVTSLSSGVASTVATITNASNSFSGGTISYLVECSDGTDFQSESGMLAFALVNKAAVVTTNLSVFGTAASALSAGTLSVVFSFSGASLQVTSTTSLTATTHRITYQIQSNSQQAVSVP